MTKQDAVPPKIRRQALATLSRDRLSSLTDHFELDVGDRRALDQHVDALVRARAAPRAHRRTRSARDVAADLKWTKKVVAAEAQASPVA
ncbi:MAG: hypothetical protein IAE78_30340, partial [Myxococcus sp.]|nr:hypothetical protein [Myxococcus sp.]